MACLPFLIAAGGTSGSCAAWDQRGAGGARYPARVRWGPDSGQPLLVAFGERIGLDQVCSLEDHFVLTIRLGAADACLGPQVMILMHLDVALGRGSKLDAGAGLADLVDVEGPRLLNSRLPQPGPEIGRLRDVADHDLVAPHLLEGLDERLVVLVLEALEILHAGIGPVDVLAADAADFVLGHGTGQDDRAFLSRVDARCGELLVEGHVRAAHDDGVDHVGLAQAYLVDHRVELGVAERVILFAHDLAAVHEVLDMLAGDLVRGARPDVIRAQEIEGLGPLGLVDPVETGDDLLGGFLPGVDDVGALLETLVEGGIVEKAVILFEYRQNRLAAGRGPAAHDRCDLVLHQEFLGLFGKGGPVGGAVFLDVFYLAPENAALGVDLLDGQLFGLNRAGLGDRHGAGDRVQDTAGHGRVGDRKPGGIDHISREILRTQHLGCEQRCRKSRPARQNGAAAQVADFG